MLTITADELPRFVVCNGSKLMPNVPVFNPDDTVRNEGNAAHWLIEQVFKRVHGTDELIGRKAMNGVFITEEMVEHVTPYLNDIFGKGEIECETSHGDESNYQVNGRADHIYYDQATQTLYVDDFKYGWSLIEPAGNWTLISHAYGWIQKNHKLPFQKISLRIFQPRPHHPEGRIRVADYTLPEITSVWIKLLETLRAPNNNLNTSAHCYKCPAMALCPAAQKAGMNAIEVSEMAYVGDVDDGTLAFLLEQSDRAITVLEQNRKAYSELALHRIKAGRIVPGYTTQKELTNRQWKEGMTVETAMILTGMDLSKKQLITPAQAEKMGVSEEAMKALCERREKGVKLTRVSADSVAKKILGGKS